MERKKFSVLHSFSHAWEKRSDKLNFFRGTAAHNCILHIKSSILLNSLFQYRLPAIVTPGLRSGLIRRTLGGAPMSRFDAPQHDETVGRAPYFLLSKNSVTSAVIFSAACPSPKGLYAGSMYCSALSFARMSSLLGFASWLRLCTMVSGHTT